MNVYIETMGCQMNKSDTERILGMLSCLGYEEVGDIKNADLLIINTCSIRQLSEDKAFSQIGTWGRMKKSNPRLKIAFCGCIAQQRKEAIFKRAPYVDLIFGTHNIYELPDLIRRINNDEKVCACPDVPFDEQDTEIRRAKGFNAWIPIIEGCNNFCTYCIVPYTRGRERSRAPEIVLAEAQKAIEAGFKEITLLGQNVDSDGKDLGNINLAELLRRLNSLGGALEGTFRIRFTTSYPSDITDELIETAASLEKVCEYFHIPMQSGSNEVLKAMNRRYCAEDYAKICAKIRKALPDVTITSDFIAGFPGETEEQFLETLKAMEVLELDYSNTAAYSPREKTAAANWTELFLDEDIKEERLRRLNEKNKECCLRSNKKYIGREMEILIEYMDVHKGKSIATGRTRNNKIVHIPCEQDISGEFIQVKITGAKTWYLKGELFELLSYKS